MVLKHCYILFTVFIRINIFQNGKSQIIESYFLKIIIFKEEGCSKYADSRSTIELLKSRLFINCFILNVEIFIFSNEMLCMNVEQFGYFVQIVVLLVLTYNSSGCIDPIENIPQHNTNDLFIF